LTSTRSRFDPAVSYYQVLDVPLAATQEQITRAYRDLMRVTHPDNFQDPDQRARAEERAKLLNAAYHVLSKPALRQEYDRQMRSTAVSDALMQRYTGNTPGRPSTMRAPPRPPPPHVIRARKRANNAATRQILVSTTAFVVVLVLVTLILLLAWRGVELLLAVSSWLLAVGS
jgi:diphthamide biosynthesis protein 4